MSRAALKAFVQEFTRRWEAGRVGGWAIIQANPATQEELLRADEVVLQVLRQLMQLIDQTVVPASSDDSHETRVLAMLLNDLRVIVGTAYGFGEVLMQNPADEEVFEWFRRYLARLDDFVQKLQKYT